MDQFYSTNLTTRATLQPCQFRTTLESETNSDHMPCRTHRRNMSQKKTIAEVPLWHYTPQTPKKRRILELQDNSSPKSDLDIDPDLKSTHGSLVTSTAAHHSLDTTLKRTKSRHYRRWTLQGSGLAFPSKRGKPLREITNGGHRSGTASSKR